MAVCQDETKGFIVKATAEISQHSLLTEYAADVDTWRNQLLSTNDSIMSLLDTSSSSSSLVISPISRGNIAKFISGINLELSDAREKENVRR
jgi:hypothetical protein